MTRRGASAGSALLVVHVWCPEGPSHIADLQTDGQMPVRVGFTVGKRVGGSVVRNRVRRRLRHLLATRLHTVPGGCDVVVSARPAAAGASAQVLRHSLEESLDRAVRRASR